MPTGAGLGSIGHLGAGCARPRTASPAIRLDAVATTSSGPSLAIGSRLPTTTLTLVEAIEEHSLLLRLLQQPPRQQRLVMAWHLDGFDASEISDQLNMPPATVRSNLRHARNRLKEFYQKRFRDPGVAGTDEGRE